MAEEHIKINPVPTKVKYSGNGVVREFPTGFAFFEDDNIVVYHNGVIINAGYSVTGVGETDGGVVTFDVAPAEGDKIVIIRKVAIERVTDFQEGGAFRAKNINDELDRQTAFCQQIQEEIDRCVKVEVTDDQSPEELLSEVYGKLDSATAVATDAILAAEQATIAAEQATTAVEEAKKQVVDTQEYVNNAKLDINNTVEAGKQEINTTIDEAQMNLSDTITQATDDVKQAAVSAAEGVISDVETDLRNGLQPLVTNAEDWANTSKIWATGEDEEVNTVAPGEEEHSSRGYADLAMAIANTPENVPVDASKLLALDVIRGPKGDSGEAEFSGDVTFTGTFDVHSDSNHPVKVTGMAGASATGYQIIDSNGLGDSDFEHYATGDRYGTRITNHNNTSDTSVSVDLYQSNAGRSVLDTTDVETVLVPTPAADDASQKAVNSEWVKPKLDDKLDADVDNLTPTGKSNILALLKPSSNFIELTPASSGTKYTAPANGWARAWGYKNTEQNIYIQIFTGSVGQTIYVPQGWGCGDISIFVAKGATFSVSGYNDISEAHLRFIYVVGESNNE